MLGRLVANPRRPLDAYRPHRHKSEGDEGHAAKLKDFTLDVAVEKKVTISATSVQSTHAALGLGQIFRSKGTVYREHERRLTSTMMKTYALEQYSDVFEQIYGENDQSLVKEFWKASSGRAYMIVSLRSAVQPHTEEFSYDRKSGEIAGKVPLAVATAGHVPPKILDPHGSLGKKMSQDAAVRGVAVGEVVFAAEYCEVAQEMQGRFSVRERTVTYKVRGVKKFNAQTLAFGTVEDDDFGEDVEDEADASMMEREDFYV